MHISTGDATLLFSHVIAFSLLLLQVSPTSAPENPWIDVSLVDGKCTFMTGDAEYNAAQLVQDLRDYEARENIDLAVQPNTPDRCVRKARIAARRAGFTTVGLKPYDTVPVRCLPVRCEPVSAVVIGNETVEVPRQ
jgi:hypothetical protein